MVNAPAPAPTDAPFGLQPNVAAGLAYLFQIIGGVVMLVGGGTNRFVKFAAAQSITFWGAFWVVHIALGFMFAMMGFALLPLFGLVLLALRLIGLVVWIWTTITAFQGKEVEIPIIGGITRQLFGSQIGV